jgi:urea transport system substrate-binding protein
MFGSRAYAHELGLVITGSKFIGLGADEVNGLVDQVEAADSDGVLMLLVGQDAVDFNRHFAMRGLDERLIRFSPLMEENMLLASGVSATKRLFVTAGYFRSLVNTDAMDLLGRYVRLHGQDAPSLNNAGESCYEGLQALAELVRRAGKSELRALNAAADGLAYHGPRGTIEFHDRQAAQQVHLAVADGFDFDVIVQL